MGVIVRGGDMTTAALTGSAIAVTNISRADISLLTIGAIDSGIISVGNGTSVSLICIFVI